MIRRFVDSFRSRPETGVVETPDSVVETEAEATARALDELGVRIRSLGALMPPLVTSRLRQLDDLLRVVLVTASAEDASTEQRFLLDTMIRDHIPTPLEAYVALSADDRRSDSRATGLLLEQTALIRETLDDLLNQIRTHAVAELSVHGRFLADKFQAPALTLDSGSFAGGR
ncbi:hypothetical protein [Frondihabitans cladoniiphilus]|uniref:FlgN protein n=1 Tax=Frondihabitans cladoniiphilus TaxID=715785 RepID=A0ABP8W7F5_9MICO